MIIVKAVPYSLWTLKMRITMCYVLDDVLTTLINEVAKNGNEAADVAESTALRYNADGSIQRRKRDDYTRGPKRIKSDQPWDTCPWLILIVDPTTADPSSRNGKEFRRKFRVPYPVFEK